MYIHIFWTKVHYFKKTFLSHFSIVGQLSRDHSLVWEIEAAMGAHVEHAADAVPKNIITRSLGPHPKVDVDLEGPFPVESGDVFVLCSDGLSGPVPDDKLLEFIQSHPNVQECADGLGQLALDDGSRDNVSCIVIEVVEN